MNYASLGNDDNAFVTAEMQGNKDLKIVEAEEDSEPNTVKTNWKIEAKDKEFNFRKILVDSGGFGCGPSDQLIELLGRKVLGLDNSKKAIGEKEWEPGMKITIGMGNQRTNKILKEDLYSNAKVLMEQGKIQIIDDLGLLNSLKSMTFEHKEEGRLKITGRNSHLAEAFVRVCWAVREKGLRVFLY